MLSRWSRQRPTSFELDQPCGMTQGYKLHSRGSQSLGYLQLDGESAQADSEVTCPLLWVSSVLLLSTQQTPVYRSLPPFNVPGGLQYQRLLSVGG